jgi:hypothetical protein
MKIYRRMALYEVVSFMPQAPALSMGKETLVPSVEGARCCKEERKILFLSEIKLKFLGHLAHCIIIILIQLTQLH